MTSDLCTEDVVVRITTPQIITSGAGGAVGGGAAGRLGLGAGAELGRRLLVAARAGDTAGVLELMAAGAPFTADWLGTSALHHAAAGAHHDTCAVLLRAGVSRDARTKVERTALHVAAGAGHARVVRLLLAAGAAVDPRDMLRMTPLHWAAARRHRAAAHELLRAGADPHALSKFNKTPHSLALAHGDTDMLRLMEDAIKEREAARSVNALVNEQTEETTEPQIQTFESVQRIQDLNFPNKSKSTLKTEKETENKTEYCGSGSRSGVLGAALLRRHGITLLPTDDGSTVLSALQSGRTVVLSDAGKLMLKESSEASAAATTTRAASTTSSTMATTANVASSVSSAATSGTSGAGVVLTATPVKSPPKPGVKIFTINNKLLTVPKDNKIPVKKIFNPQDMQVKFLQLAPDAKIISPSKLVPLKSKNRVVTRTSPSGGVTSTPAQRPAVKIIMNKNNFNRFLATAAKPTQTNKTNNGFESGAEVAGGVVSTPAQVCAASGTGAHTHDEAALLRAQLAAATHALHAARHELTLTRAKLAHYETLDQ